jgi:hypothetical protein
MNRTASIAVSIVTAFAWGCGGGGGQPPAPPPSTAPATTAPAPARTLDLCAVAPDADVAQALGAKVREPSRASQLGGSECDYDFDFGDRRSGFFFAWAGKPELYFSREMATGDVEPVAGLGQDAFVEHAMPEDAWDLHVLLAPDLALEVKGDRKQQVLGLGRFLAGKLR